MKQKVLRISAVSYTNALPYVYGINKSGFLNDYSLSLDIPSLCAEKLIKDQADVGLVPVAAIPYLKKHNIFPDFCIGANGPVHSVMLYSDVPLKDIKNIFLDYQSKTSVMLVQVLAKFSWQINPQYIAATEGYESKIKDGSAGVIIGDRNFFMSKKYEYVYDLSEHWKLFTGLPFVFACWVTNKNISTAQSDALYQSFEFGVDNRNDSINQLAKRYDRNFIKTYLSSYVSYYFDIPKQQAMNLFLNLSKKII